MLLKETKISFEILSHWWQWWDLYGSTYMSQYQDQNDRVMADTHAPNADRVRGSGGSELYRIADLLA